jgi:signal peptidase I
MNDDQRARDAPVHDERGSDDFPDGRYPAGRFSDGHRPEQQLSDSGAASQGEPGGYAGGGRLAARPVMNGHRPPGDDARGLARQHESPMPEAKPPAARQDSASPLADSSDVQQDSWAPRPASADAQQDPRRGPLPPVRGRHAAAAPDQGPAGQILNALPWRAGTAHAGTASAGSGNGAPPGPPAAGPAARSPGSRMAARVAERRRRRSFWRELPVLVVVALGIALLIKTFVVQAFFIPTGSMENTLIPGDKVLVNKVVYHLRKIEPGDIVVFSGLGSWDQIPPPSRPSSDPIVRAYDATLRPLFRSISGLFGTVPGQTDYIKRVIGVPGDHVRCCNSSGQITVNGVPIDEQSYLFPGARSGSAPQGYSGRFDIVVPPGRLWVLGDNRALSADSRLHRSAPGGGTIPENKVVGRAFLIVWPLSRWRVLPVPATFSQPGIHTPAASSAAPGVSPPGLGASGAVAAGLAAGLPVRPSSPLLPLAAGAGLALPVTWLQRRARPAARAGAGAARRRLATLAHRLGSLGRPSRLGRRR